MPLRGAAAKHIWPSQSFNTTNRQTDTDPKSAFLASASIGRSNSRRGRGRATRQTIEPQDTPTFIWQIVHRLCEPIYRISAPGLGSRVATSFACAVRGGRRRRNESVINQGLGRRADVPQKNRRSPGGGAYRRFSPPPAAPGSRAERQAALWLGLVTRSVSKAKSAFCS